MVASRRQGKWNGNWDQVNKIVGGGERKKTRLDDKKARRQSAMERILL